MYYRFVCRMHKKNLQGEPFFISKDDGFEIDMSDMYCEDDTSETNDCAEHFDMEEVNG